MNEYLILAAGMILLPGIYICLTFWQTEKFNGMSKFEVIVLAAAEIAFVENGQRRGSAIYFIRDEIRDARVHDIFLCGRP